MISHYTTLIIVRLAVVHQILLLLFKTLIVRYRGPRQARQYMSLVQIRQPSFTTEQRHDWNKKTVFCNTPCFSH